jgi:hypothetical protein
MESKNSKNNKNLEQNFKNHYKNNEILQNLKQILSIGAKAPAPRLHHCVVVRPMKRIL